MPRDGPHTLVAITTFWRAPGVLCSHWPMIFSVVWKVSGLGGTAYSSAVSRKLMPRARAWFRMAWLAGVSTCSPKVMVPRQMGLTCSSLVPSWMVFMGAISGGRLRCARLFLQAQHAALHLAGGGHGQGLARTQSLWGTRRAPAGLCTWACIRQSGVAARPERPPVPLAAGQSGASTT